MLACRLARHPVVAVLIPYIGASLEDVRARLVEREREVKKTEEARRLSEESSRIAEILNKDFQVLQARLREIRAATARPGDVEAVFGDSASGDDTDSVWVAGIQEPGIVPTTGAVGEGMEPKGREAPELAAAGVRDDSGTDSVDPAGDKGSRHTRPRGGFSVDYRHIGAEEDRSKYDPGALAIIINLDHPVVVAALGRVGVQDVGFRRLSYEIAFAEYSVALGYEMARVDPDIPADDLLYEVRRTMNRIARSSASLYS